MADKTFRVWLFPIFSLSVVPVWFSLNRQLPCFPYLDLWFAAHDGRLFLNWSCFLSDLFPLLLVALFGFLRAKPKEIWSYGLLMGTPILLLTLANLPDDEAKFTLPILGGFFVAATLAAYAGYELRKLLSTKPGVKA